ncbi:GNAT family N-acetyltransferase [Alphaproteobacteria bacterium KMM 3653]|uniref:L-ornithine N(alpha)-acyltransferase n=2 Tax=Harenicola maris TaxID=2841044 RepID=A0AAP2CNT4_9RHOB|nr:GNAT family N-acetyltransferase [Harenicola maris]
MAQVMALRALCFRGDAQAEDADTFDPACQHVQITDRIGGQTLCTFRLLKLPSGAQIERSYAAQFYGLGKLETYPAPMMEVGRFCIRPGRQDADILRVAWGVLTRLVDEGSVGMLFGCSSFQGVDAAPYRDALGLLRARHRAPDHFAPVIQAIEAIPFDAAHCGDPVNLKQAQSSLPPLLRTYLVMGGWVSDHAVVDRELGTLHVFTGLEISAVPPARARLLRAVAQ